MRIFQDGERLTAHGDVRWRRSVDPGPLVICVEPPSACAVPPETIPQEIPGQDNVWGRVLHLDGTPLEGVTVEVREVTNTAETVLLSTNTDADGWYAATISPPKDIVVRVLEPTQPPAQPRLLGSSRAHFSPSFPVRIDVDICDEKYRQATEWSRLSGALTPLLGATAPEDADTRRVAVLSGRTGWDVERITLWVLAHKIGQAIPADAESLYGLLRLGFPRRQEALLSRPRSTVGPALSRAAGLNLIAGDKAVPPDLDTFLAALSAGLEGALNGTRKDTLGEILRTSGVLTATQITEFIGLYADHTDSEDEFWDLVFTPPSSGLPSFDAASKAEARRLVTLSTLALSYAPAVASILVTIGSGPASDVAGIDAAGWDTIVSPSRLPTLPEGLPGADDTERRAALAGYLAEHAERMFPAATARASLIAAIGSGHALEPAKSFLLANPTFDLATSRVDDPAFTGTDAEKDAAKKAQRLYRVAPEVGRAEVIAALGDAGFGSAGSIARCTRARFVAEQGAALGVETAELVARKAATLQAITTTFVLQAHPTNSQAEYAFLPNESFDTGDVADWETLFGNTDACACPWCRSVHGPAAYLVDLLSWLKDRDVSAGTGPTLYDELISRRPDLANIALSCENAERALPYIDLVLEALESAVANTTNPGEVDTDAAHDTVVTTPDMLAAPQYRNDAAYTTLATSTTAVELPFHRPLEEARAFLAHLGVPRAELLRAWEDAGTLTADDLATEQLGLFAARLATITAATGSELAYWPVSALSELESVPTLRRVGELSWPEILDLLHTRYVNPRTWNSTDLTWDRVLEIGATDWCDIDTYTVQLVGGGSPAEVGWTRLRQFLRLWRAVDGTALDLDKVLDALGVDDLHADPWLEDLGRLHRLAGFTGLDLVELSQVGASRIDTFEDRDIRDEPVASIYDRVFLSPAVMVEGDPEYAFFQLDEQRAALASTGETLADHAAAVAGALGWTRDELDVVLGETGLSDLTLANLTTLHAWSVVGRATGLRPEDLLGLVGLTGLSPLTSTADLAELVETASEIADAGWTIDELRYLVAHERSERVGATDDFVQLALGRLRDALRAALSALGEGSTEASVREEALQVLAEQLGADKDALDGLRSLSWSGLPTLSAGTAFTLAEDATVTPTTGTVDLAAGTLCTIPAGTAITRDGVAETLEIDTVASLDGATTATVSTVAASQGAAWTLSASGDATFSADTSFTLDSANLPGSTSLSVDGETLVLTAATDVSFVDAVTPASAVTGALSLPSEPPAPDIIQRFLRDEFLAGETTTETPYDDITASSTVYADDITVFRALHKAALLLSHLDLDEDERTFWFDPTNTSAWSIAAVDGLAGDGAASFTFAELKALIDLFAQRRRIPGSSPGFVELLEASGTASDFAAALSERTDWNEDDLAALAAQTGADPSTVSGLETLLDRMAIVRRTGADAATVTGWAVAPGDVDADTSAQVVAAARARHATTEAWGAVARPVRDVLRKAQRDALVAWLLAEVGDADIEDADDLYEHYLIDVSMNPEMLTSRIVQAAATVQLYVHRLMLGLERDGSGAMVFEPNAEDREQWEWMHTYRVWEAARKVFLYPENWIEPELRDDKSPFFVDLERELAQGDVTDERIEQALLDYLDRLREVSNLQVLAYTWQKEELGTEGGDDIDVLHVFARTRSEPPSYWYRRLEDQERWTPWEKVECGVEGSHLVPVVFQRRLLLFWLKFGEGSEEGDDSTRQEVTVSWSEYRDGRWFPARVSGSVPASGEPDRVLFMRDASDSDALVLLVSYRAAVSNIETRELYDTGYVEARFELDPCTLDLAGESVSDRETRVGAVDTFWSTPGFSTDPDTSDALDWATTLAVYQASLDEGELAPEETWTEARLLGTPGAVSVVVPGDGCDFASQAPFFVQTGQRCWFVVPGEADPEPDAAVGKLGTLRETTWVVADNPSAPTDATLLADQASYLPKSRYTDETAAIEALTAADLALVEAFDPSTFNLGAGGYRFTVFYHPHVCTFTEAVRRDGVFALLDPDPDGPEANLSTGSLRRQQLTGAFDFEAELDPDPNNVSQPYPVEDVDFSEAGAYSGYNWELFFHVPLYVASRLMDTGRHDDAMRMLHAIFDPRVGDDDLPAGAEASARWWKVAPFMEPVSTPVTDWIAFAGASGDTDAAEDFAHQVEAWRDDPFNPHLIARLRPGTYQKVTVMRYVENLVAWGDALFSRDTLESINEATQLYVFARQILGDRPEILEPRDKPVAKSFAELLADGAFDAFGNVILENAWTAEVPATGTGSAATALTASTTLTTYFCVPHNARLLSYWDTVEDRLFKIRNGMNIEGVVRSLPLFQPPIDPALLVRAAAAGIDIGTALDDLSVSLPHHRFAVLHGRATAIAGSVRALSQALLTALEKKDAEALAALRQDQELALLDAVGEVRELQIDEAQRSLEALRKSKALVKVRKKYYDKLIDTGWIAEETQSADLTRKADNQNDTSASLAMLGSLLGAIPDFYASVPPAVKTGGVALARVAGASATYYGMLSARNRSEAGMASTRASYKRRAQEWQHQSKQAELELAQLDKQIAAAEIRLEIARREQKNHALQVRHAEQVSEFLSRKFTNEELYRWMSGQLSALYFQQYQLALATAKKAQACYNHELGRSDSFIQSVYWDSLRKGLLAGERLAADLERMDVAYLEHDRRELELVKQVSLSRLDPLALVRLRQEGECYFELPEVLFDLDCPGHVNRRLVSVALTASCVGGPHGQVNLRLTLHGSKLRPTASDDLEAETCTYPSIVTSTAAEDSGVFGREDGRYQPFERLGAVSSWHLAFANQEYPQLDWDSVSDVTLHLRYTARDGGESWRASRLAEIPGELDALKGGFIDLGTSETSDKAVVALSARRDAPDAWAQAQEDEATSITLSLADRLPYFAVGRNVTVDRVHVVVMDVAPSAGSVSFDGGGTSEAISSFAAWPSGSSEAALGSTSDGLGESWPDELLASTTLASGSLADADDLLVVLEFSVS